MIARRIVNASPLILLSKANHLELLRNGANRVIVPDAVFEEVALKGQTDPTVRAILAADWLEVAPVGEIPDRVAAWRLGRGESAVLASA